MAGEQLPNPDPVGGLTDTERAAGFHVPHYRDRVFSEQAVEQILADRAALLTPDERVAVEAARWVARVEAERDEARQGLADLAAKVEAVVADYSARVEAMSPDNYRTGQDHLPPAFREIDFRAAFLALGELVNGFEASLRAVLTADSTPRQEG